MPAPTYIISKVADPIFAVFIGLSAAATRINREEKEKGRTTTSTLEATRRHVIFTAWTPAQLCIQLHCISFPF